MYIKVTTLAEAPEIQFGDIATADYIDVYLRRTYGIQLNGKPHEWLWMCESNKLYKPEDPYESFKSHA
jgi:hypothetical protein